MKRYEIITVYSTRFLSTVNDPSSVNELNLFSYAVNNPITFEYNKNGSIDISGITGGLGSGCSYASGKTWNLLKTFETFSNIKDYINMGYSINQASRYTYYMFKNGKAFFDDMIMQGIKSTDAMNSFTGFSWNLSGADIGLLGLDIGLDIYDSIQSGLSWKGTLVGGGLTAVKGIGMIYASKAIIYGSTALFSVIIPIPGVGAVVGFVVGTLGAIAFDYFVGKWLDGLIGDLKRQIG